jgi:hypothetical protein
MLIAPGMWPGSYWRAAGRESMMTTPFFGGMLTFCLTKSKSTSALVYQPSLGWMAAASAAKAGTGYTSGPATSVAIIAASNVIFLALMMVSL